MKLSILSALDALKDGDRVGLAVFSHKIGLFDLRSRIPHVRYTRLPCTRQGSLGGLRGTVDEGVPLPLPTHDYLSVPSLRSLFRLDGTACTFEKLHNHMRA